MVNSNKVPKILVCIEVIDWEGYILKRMVTYADDDSKQFLIQNTFTWAIRNNHHFESYRIRPGTQIKHLDSREPEYVRENNKIPDWDGEFTEIEGRDLAGLEVISPQGYVRQRLVTDIDEEDRLHLIQKTFLWAMANNLKFESWRMAPGEHIEHVDSRDPDYNEEEHKYDDYEHN